MTAETAQISNSLWPGRETAVKLLNCLNSLELIEGAEGFQQAKEDLDERIRLIRQKVLDDLGPRGPAIVAFLGGTNVGKSTLFNVLLGEVVGKPSEVARGTRSPAVYVHQQHLDRLKESSFLAGYERHSLQNRDHLNAAYDGPPRAFFMPHLREDLRDLVIIDAPDLDSNHIQNHRVAKDVLFSCDVAFYVTSNQKYRDEICENFLARAAALGKRIYVIFNYQNPKAIADFSERFKKLTGEVVQDHRLVKVDYCPGAKLSDGPWVPTIRDWLPSITHDREVIRRNAHSKTCQALPDELGGILLRYKKEVDVIEGLRQTLLRRARQQAQAYVKDTRKNGFPEMDEILALVMKELRVPGVDAVYDAIFETAKGLFKSLRSYLSGGDKTELLRKARDKREAELLRTHFNDFVGELRDSVNDLEPGYAVAINKFLPKSVLQRTTDDAALELMKFWRDQRRDVIESARDKIITDLENSKLSTNFIRTAKLMLRAGGIGVMVYTGGTVAADLALSGAADLGLRLIIDKVLGDKYRGTIESQVTRGIEEKFKAMIETRVIGQIDDALPTQLRNDAFVELETLLVSVKNDARERE